MTYAIELSSQLPWVEVLATAAITAGLVLGGIAVERWLTRRQRLAELYLDLVESRDALIQEVQWSLFRDPPDPGVYNVDVESSFRDAADVPSSIAAQGVVACVGAFGARSLRKNWAAWRRGVVHAMGNRARLVDALKAPIEEPAGVDQTSLTSTTALSHERTRDLIGRVRETMLNRLNDEHPSTLKPWVLAEASRSPDVRDTVRNLEGLKEVRRTLILGWIDDELGRREDQTRTEADNSYGNDHT